MAYYSGDGWDYWSNPSAVRTDPMENYYRAKQAAERTKKQDSTASNNAIADRAVEAAQIQAEAATKAAQIQAASADKATALQEKRYEESKGITNEAVEKATGEIDPWREAGLRALEELEGRVLSGPGEYTESPGYQFRLNEGQKAIERSAAAKGNALSGQAVKAAARYGQDYATQDYDNFLRRYYDSLAPLERMSGTGVNTGQAQGNYIMQGAGNVVNAGQNTANQINANTIYGGEAQAGGVMNAANIIAAQQAAAAERDYAYNAWKEGRDF